MHLHLLTVGWGQATDKSCPTRPANRPVNALTHDQAGLPRPIAEMRNPPGTSGNHSRKEMRHV